MDLYLFCFYLGFGGFLLMTLLGLSHAHGDGGSHGHGNGHGNGAHSGHIAHAGHAGHSSHPVTGHHSGHGIHSHGAAKLHGGGASKAVWMLLSPRVIFSILLGFGAAGLLLQSVLGGALLAIVSALLAWFFERGVVTPIWGFLLQFASAPARTLESTLLEPAEAVANFDARGEGVVSVQLNGQLVQMLGRLEPSDRASGIRVRAGDRLMITAVDPQRHSCTVARSQV